MCQPLDQMDIAGRVPICLAGLRPTECNELCRAREMCPMAPSASLQGLPVGRTDVVRQPPGDGDVAKGYVWYRRTSAQAAPT